jgi:hypothetical protein
VAPTSDATTSRRSKPAAMWRPEEQQHRAGAGGSIGRERIAVRDFRGRGGSYLCSIYRNVRLIRG